MASQDSFNCGHPFEADTPQTAKDDVGPCRVCLLFQMHDAFSEMSRFAMGYYDSRAILEASLIICAQGMRAGRDPLDALTLRERLEAMLSHAETWREIRSLLWTAHTADFTTRFGQLTPRDQALLDWFKERVPLDTSCVIPESSVQAALHREPGLGEQ